MGSVLEGCREVSPRINVDVTRQMIFSPRLSLKKVMCSQIVQKHTRYAYKIICPAKFYLQLSRDCNVFNKKAAVKACHQTASLSGCLRVQNILAHSSISALSQISQTPNH